MLDSVYNCEFLKDFERLCVYDIFVQVVDLLVVSDGKRVICSAFVFLCTALIVQVAYKSGVRLFTYYHALSVNQCLLLAGT